jgi:hypothetical protein
MWNKNPTTAQASPDKKMYGIYIAKHEFKS